MFFVQFLSIIKVNHVAKIMQSAYLCVIFHFNYKKNTISRGFNLILNFGQNSRLRQLLVTSQASNSATTHKIHLILLRRSKHFH